MNVNASNNADLEMTFRKKVSELPVKTAIILSLYVNLFYGGGELKLPIVFPFWL